MRGWDLAALALNGIAARKLRSALTSLGVIIGSAAFVSLVLVGSTLEATIESQLEGLGAEQIRVVPGVQELFQQDGPPVAEAPPEDIRFTLDDEEALRRTAGVLDATGRFDGRSLATYRGESARVAVQGVEPDSWARIVDPEIEAGRLLRANEARSVVLGADAARGLFTIDLDLNQQFTLQGESFRVVGILAEGVPDATFYVERDTAWRLLDSPEEISSLVARRSPTADEADTAEAMERSLLRSRGLNPEDIDFTILTPTEVRESIEEVTGTARIFLGTISGISLLVGGIGIANTMFMTVLERSKQIGILKAVGMTRQQVVVLFLMESALLALFGGVLGGIVGAGGAQALGALLSGADAPGLIVTLETIGIMAAVAVTIGSLAGAIPANRAASVPPMESLQGQ